MSDNSALLRLVSGVSYRRVPYMWSKELIVTVACSSTVVEMKNPQTTSCHPLVPSWGAKRSSRSPKTYKEIASQLGNPKGARAVGGAEATNPMPLVIPCHRVLGSDGGLHGYGAGKGLETKAWLLELEGVER